ncbi:type II secretion system minor pseudopilin GspK [Parvularcula sp. IMCC14364]|uniref:type II secretion system minor pseudopilin GspK n=1 Tax=Parvularcula sp. IMCC14364 TaxID=3067902 RepID=UPI002740B66C|nr:type II secretion system minor pseudopilin GspK [Parvularcula sp. IMCC14364]
MRHRPCIRRRAGRKAQRGVALLVVLLLMATLAAIAIAMTRTVQVTTARAFTAEALTQARWYIEGAETFGLLLLEAQWQQQPARDTLQDIWAKEPATFPLETGLMTASMKDETVCFNLNSLVSSSEQERRADPAAITEYQLLLTALEIPGSLQRALTDSLVDWLDTDGLPNSEGAEDAAYASLEVPYRAGNTLLADISELRSIYWYSGEVYARLAPFVCAHPTTQRSPLNINMVTEDNALVLYAMMGGAVSLNETIRLLEARPEGGFETVDQFWALLPEAASGTIDESVQSRPNLWSRYITLKADVNHHDATLAMTSLIEVSRDGSATAIRRKFGLMN